MKITGIYFNTFLQKILESDDFIKKLLKRWFHEISLNEGEFLVFSHCSKNSIPKKFHETKEVNIWTEFSWVPVFQSLEKEKLGKRKKSTPRSLLQGVDIMSHNKNENILIFGSYKQ